MTRCFLSFAIAVLLIGTISGVVSAQATGGPAFPAVFGGSGSRGTTHSMDATVSVLGAYEDNGNDSDDPAVSIFETTGFYSSVNGTLGYLWQGTKVQVGANVGSEGRYYRDRSDFINTNNYAGIGVAATLARRTTLSLNQTVSYSPAYFGGLFPSLPTSSPGAVDARGGDYATSELYARTYETSAGVGYGLTRNGTVNFSTSVRQTNFDAASGYDDLRSYSVGGRYTQRMSRNASLRLGYAYRQGEYGFVSSAVNTGVHDIDAGVDYSRALSLFRRTTFDFGVGSAIVTQPTGVIQSSGIPESQLQYQLLGNAGLNHEISRTWRARLAYNRGLGFVDGLPEPVFSNGVNASVGGFVNRRIEVQTSGAYTNGDVGRNSQANSLKAFTAAARMQVGLSRMWAASAEYFYYWYDIGTGVQLPIGVPRFRERSGVHAGLTLWLPLVRQ